MGITTETFTLTLESNIEDAPLYGSSKDLEANSEVTVIAGSMNQYRFSHWENTSTGAVLSTDTAYTFTITTSLHLRAVYEATSKDDSNNDDDNDVPDDNQNDDNNNDDDNTDDSGSDNDSDNDSDTGDEEDEDSDNIDPDDNIEIESYRVIFGFEEGVKTSYNLGMVTMLDIPFLFVDALIGTSEDDLAYGEKSVRIRNGFIQPSFGIIGLEEVSFSVGRHKTSAQGSYSLEYSFDNTNWTRYGRVREANERFETIIYRFDDNFYQTTNQPYGTPVFFRIISNDDYLVNVDHLSIRYGSKGSIAYPDGHEVSVSVTSDHPFNIATLSPKGTIRVGDTVTITSTDYEGYTFSHWQDIHTRTIFSYHQTLTFNVERALELRAYYIRD